MTDDECWCLTCRARRSREATWNEAIDAAAQAVHRAAENALAGTGDGYGDEAYERAVIAARRAWDGAHSIVCGLRIHSQDGNQQETT